MNRDEQQLRFGQVYIILCNMYVLVIIMHYAPMHHIINDKQ